MLPYRRLFFAALTGLALACTFNPGLNPEKYWPCAPDGKCPGECECFDGRVCIPPNTEDDPVVCKWCEPGHVDCDGIAGNGCEANLADDPETCGDCKIQCPDGWFCEVGTCVQGCREGFVECGGGCVDPLRDPKHCGGCGQACKSSQVCLDGECQDDCGLELRDCNGSCTDIRSDPENCGECGRLCVLPNARPKCELSVCLVDTCVHPFGDCDRQVDGCETDLKNSSTDCGSCGNACGIHSGCLGGECKCDEYFADCDENPDTGCEIMIKTNPRNCGECGRVCDQPPQDHCDESILVVYPRLGDCSEYTCRYEPTSTDCPFGCDAGQCLGDPCHGVQCGEGEICVNGVCACGGTGPDCIGEQVCCGTACVDLWNNPDHCGECFMTCGPNAFCEGVQCNCSSQEVGDCNGSWADGCETYLYESDENCGDCGYHCPTGELCCAGTCVDTTNNDLNCGACGIDCPAGKICCDGVCTDTTSSSEHCGECFNACVANRPCSQGTCGSVGIDCAGTFCDPQQGQICCSSSGGGMACSNVGDCTAHIFDCDGPEDCDAGSVCCGTMSASQATACTPVADCPTNLLCTSDLQCQEANPNRPFCCPESLQGVEFFVCMNTCP
jgi:hypothetical protein